MSTFRPPSYLSDGPPRYQSSSSLSHTLSNASGISVSPRFRIGDKSTIPVVTIESLKTHLALLGAFARLRQDVEECKDPTDFCQDPEVRWNAFLHKALFRFNWWVNGIVDATSRKRERADGRLKVDEFPPLDVLMIWHSYLLNPRTYYEDSLRMYPGLGAIKEGMPLMDIVLSMIDPETLRPLPPPPEAQETWTSITKQPWDLPFHTGGHDARPTSCPNCGYLHQIPWVILQVPSVAGREEAEARTDYWLSPNLAITCSCGQSITKTVLANYRMAMDIYGPNLIDPTKASYLANTILDPPTGTPSLSVADKFNQRLTKRFLDPKERNKGTPKREPAPSSAKECLRHDRKDFEIWFKEGMAGTTDPRLHSTPVPRRVSRVLAAYAHPDPFSIELVGAAPFITRISKLNWLIPNRFDMDPSLLIRSIARYHAFLDLMSSSPGKFFVPTLDIDLAWHTHQLMGMTYVDKTVELLRRLVDHDDKVEEGTLSNGYDLTARAWKSRFGVDYSICGCPLPSDSTFTKLKMNFRSKQAKSDVLNGRPDLLGLGDSEFAEATHPSEHNSVIVLNSHVCDQRADKRRKEYEERMEKLDKLLMKGKGDEVKNARSARSKNHGV